VAKQERSKVQGVVGQDPNGNGQCCSNFCKNEKTPKAKERRRPTIIETKKVLFEKKYILRSFYIDYR